ncbi:transcriptional repressor [Desulfuribacillus stibiiarsenatis]|uniref:Transcriptional repressor n=1 Tax=Desulfuribacillus stibiiarsenatis TaxID=1390249 RepID=A0A1E5LAA7_9FIRM|nr:transcriptional repressor [Desulfuribacillus stibiiarsenatis]
MSAQEIIRELHSCNVRVTPQRLKILSYLKGTDTHPTAEEIYQNVSENCYGLSLATVYNTLNLLKEHNLVLELKYGDLASRFDGNVMEHYHVYCKKCGKVSDFMGSPVNEVKLEAEEATGFAIESVRLDLYGYCGRCQTKHDA